MLQEPANSNSFFSAISHDHDPNVKHYTPAGIELRRSDQWLLSYVDVSNINSLVEAFDDDASGFVSVHEANLFSSSKSKDYKYV